MVLPGTLDGTKTHKLVLEGLFGTVNKVISTELQDKKQLADLKNICFDINYDNGSRQYVNSLNYQEEMTFLVAHEKRNKFIVNKCQITRQYIVFVSICRKTWCKIYMNK